MLPWQELYESGTRPHDPVRYNSILDSLGYSFSMDICNQMRPILEKSIHELEDAVVNYDKDNSTTKEKKQITLAKEIAIKNGFIEMRSIKVEDERLLMFEIVVIILLSLHPEKCKFKYEDNYSLLAKYPEFQSIDKNVELDKLRAFANYMNFALHFITAKYNRQHVFNIVTKITDGKDVKYITGSGKTKSTADRVLIYNREGGIVPKPRPVRTQQVITKPGAKVERKVHELQQEPKFEAISEVIANQAMIIPNPHLLGKPDDAFIFSSLGKRPISVISNQQIQIPSPHSSDLDILIPGDDGNGLNFFS